MDLSPYYANVGGTIYDKASGQAFSTPQQFFQHSGQTSFNGLTLDTNWKPPVPYSSTAASILTPTLGTGLNNSNTNSTSTSLTGQYTPGNYTLNGKTFNQQGELVSGPSTSSSNPQLNNSQSFGDGSYIIDTGPNAGSYDASGQRMPFPNNGVLANGTQTYKLGNGSIYDSSGNIISQPGQNVNTNAGPNISANSPNNTTNSSSLGQGPSNASILQSLTNSYNNEQQMFANLGQFATVSQSEQDLQQKVAADQAQVQALGYQEQGLYNPGNQAIALPFLTGQAQNKMVSAQLQQTIDQASLAYAQGNRQFAFNSASTIYNASRNNLADMVSIYQASAPKNISTNYNPLTGAVNTTMINPLTGETYEVSNGNIGASQPIQNVSSQVNPLTGQLTIVGTNAAGQPITYSLDSNGKITGNSIQGGSTSGSIQGGQPGSLVSSNINPQAVVGGYDLTSYAGASSATGSYGPTVNGIYQNMPTISNAQDAQSYINSVSGNSPITGQMVMSAAQQYGVDPKVMMAVMQEESSMGTKGMATSTFNPGNVGNNSDTGKSTNWGSWQAGVNAVAHNLSERQINPVQTAGSNIQGASSPQQVIQQVVSSLPSVLQPAVKYTIDGTPYLDGNQITGAQIPMAQAATQMGIPYINSDNANKLNTITATQKNLQDFQTLADAALSSNGWGGQFLNYAGLVLGNIGGGTKLNDFNSYRSSAINAIQSLAGGNGFRLTQAEVNIATDNLPTPTDTKAQADQKLKDLNSQLNSWIGTIMPGWVPPQ